MSSLLNKIKKLLFFTHYPKNHEVTTINNITEEFLGKNEKWNEWFSSYYINGIWYIGEPCTIVKFTGTNFLNNGLGDFSNSIVDWGDGTIESPLRLSHTYSENKEYIIKIIDAPYNNSYCFYMTNLKFVDIPNNITTIGLYCFYGCTNLTEIILPNEVTTLSNQCFYNCSNLEKIDIPLTVTTIGSYCFYGCSNLNKYNLHWNTENTIISYDSNKMPNNTNTIFHIPQGTKQLYINKGYPGNKLQERG